MSKAVSKFGEMILRNDKTLITSRALDYFGQDAKNSLVSGSPFGRIFLNDSVYEGMVVNKQANGYGRLTYLEDGNIVKNMSGNWKDGVLTINENVAKFKYSKQNVKIISFNALQWKIVDLFES